MLSLTVFCYCLVATYVCRASEFESGNGIFSDYEKYDVYENSHNVFKRDAVDDSLIKKTTITKKPTNTSKVGLKPSLLKSNKSSPINENPSDLSYTDEVPPTDIPLNANQTEDHHTYYNSTFYTEPNLAMSFWVNISTFAKHQIVAHEMLSNSHRRAATVVLPFNFPFYGHPIKNMTIATGGFLYAGDHVHSWLAATQYIAALMANFDTSLSNLSTIQYAYNDMAFVVQWSDVMLQDKTPEGYFSFQIILLKTGDIIFVYKDVPFPIQDIPDTKHPVKVGISDAYIIDRTVFFIRRKTIYEYHRADLKKFNISSNTAIYFKALPTCIEIDNCDSCVSANIGFECGWCDAAQLCSDGFDRHRQDWIVKNCETISKEAKCYHNVTTSTASPNSSLSIPTGHTLVFPASGDSQSLDIHGPNSNYSNSAYYNHHSEEETTRASGGNAGLVSVLIIIAFMSGIALWIFYAYKNPQSPSGQLLIKYRPTQWRWGSSEARYTAASIHM